MVVKRSYKLIRLKTPLELGGLVMLFKFSHDQFSKGLSLIIMSNSLKNVERVTMADAHFFMND